MWTGKIKIEKDKLMISYIFLFLGSIIYLYPRKSEINANILYVIIFSSLVFSHAILGFISLILIHNNLSRFPIFLIAILILLINFFFDRKALNKFTDIKNFLGYEIRNFLINTKVNYSSKIIFYFC